MDLQATVFRSSNLPPPATTIRSQPLLQLPFHPSAFNSPCQLSAAQRPSLLIVKAVAVHLAELDWTLLKKIDLYFANKVNYINIF